MTNSKECYRCKLVKPLGEFDESTRPYVHRVKANLGHMLSCKICTEPETLKADIIRRYPERNRAWWKD